MARSDVGRVKKVSGSADSTIRPPSMNTTRLAARRANPISWVTTTMVMPSRASDVMTSRTSLIISGSSADVGSSKSITLGSIASARAMATRCCWPPDSWAGYLSAWLPTPTRSSSSRARCLGLALRRRRTLTGPEGHVLQHGLVREQVEALEHHPDVGPQAGERLALLGQQLAVDADLALLDGFQPVDRAAQRGLARARGADDDHDLAGVDGEVDVLQHVQVAEPLLHAGELHERTRVCGAGHTPDPRGPRSPRVTGAVTKR